jgi:hypothetical protein
MGYILDYHLAGCIMLYTKIFRELYVDRKPPYQLRMASGLFIAALLADQ